MHRALPCSVCEKSPAFAVLFAVFALRQGYCGRAIFGFARVSRELSREYNITFLHRPFPSGFFSQSTVCRQKNNSKNTSNGENIRKMAYISLKAHNFGKKSLIYVKNPNILLKKRVLRVSGLAFLLQRCIL